VLPGSRIPALLDGVVEAMRALRPACIVDLGDRINGVAAGQDGVRERYVRRRLEDAGVPVYHVLGNTDIEHLAKHDALAAVQKSRAAEIVDVGPLRLILLDTVDSSVDGVGGAVGTAQLEWLRAALPDHPGPCLVFGHHPLDEPVLEGHRYFAGQPSLATVHNRAAVRGILEASGDVAGVFAGHLHRTGASTLRGIPYVTIGSVVDTAYTAGEPAGAYAVVTAGPGVLEVRVFGRAPADFRWPLP
jgi:3',5'-cyclic-AMP phosphodiesterase